MLYGRRSRGISNGASRVPMGNGLSFSIGYEMFLVLMLLTTQTAKPRPVRGP